MFLTEKYHALLPFHNHRKAPPPAVAPAGAGSDSISGSRFEAALAARLASLLPLPASPSSPLALLARVADLLAATLADAAPALLAGGEEGDASAAAAVAEHLDAGVALLDACNAIAARVDRLRRRRLLARFALHLLSPPLCTSSTRRAQAALADRAAVDPNSPPLPSIPFDPPRRHRHNLTPSPAARVLLAVNAVSSLAAAAAAAILDRSNSTTLFPLVPPATNLPWAEPFNALSIHLSAIALSSTTEVDAVNEAVGKLASALENEEEEESAVRAAAREVEARTEELAARLERLSDAVNGVFRAALRLRDAELGTFMVAGPPAQQTRK